MRIGECRSDKDLLSALDTARERRLKIVGGGRSSGGTTWRLSRVITTPLGIR